MNEKKNPILDNALQDNDIILMSRYLNPSPLTRKEKLMNKLLYCISLSLLCFPIFAQDGGELGEFVPWCGTMGALVQQENEDPTLKKRMDSIEKVMQEYIKNPTRDLGPGGVLIVPVVVHVIHNGDPVGSNENIDDLYILAQLDQITEDFRKMNSDASTAWAQAADTEIEFCLAQLDPNGDPTTGILRHDISGGPWTSGSFDANVKPSTIWDRDLYMNFWIADLQGGLLGYAQFPGGSANTDGIVCKYNTIGSLTTPYTSNAPYNVGRVAAHEAGHWFNLRHIWGDESGCSGTDFCADTPNQAGNTFGCPSGVVTDNCATTSPGKMYQNYMDYTDSDCMNIFTQDQADRMWAAVNTSRPGLITSVCSFQPPVAYFSPNYGPLTFCGATSGLINFENLSLNGATTLDWTFTGVGATPATSTETNPAVTVNSSGILTASLTVTNPQGVDTYTVDLSVGVYGYGATECDCDENYSGINALSGIETGNGGPLYNGDYETYGVIESTQMITSGTVDYDSSLEINLFAGFEVATGVTFDVFIDGCNNGGGGNSLQSEDDSSDNK